MTEPLVSIVLPTYNGSRYLAQAIESCLAQTWQDWELIVVDDASTDSTPDIVQGYSAKDSRIRSVRNPQNRKLPGSLNVGFSLARGRYLTWTSDDNLYRPDALSKMLAFLEEHEGVDLVYADYTAIDGYGESIERVSLPEPRRLGLQNCVGACFLYRRAVQEKLGGYAEDLFLAEDYDFWLRASRYFQLHHLPEDLYLYRWHEVSLTQAQAVRIPIASDRAVIRHLPHLAWMRPEEKAEAYLGLAYHAKLRNEYGPALKYMLCLIAASPVYFFRFLRGRLR